jgi:Ni/Co efflux regulator RcnB
MKILLIAATAAFALAGTGIASAQTTNADIDANVNAGSTHAGTKTSMHKHRRHHGTTGSGIETPDNNASARGSLLPGKDRLNSRAFIKNK